MSLTFAKAGYKKRKVNVYINKNDRTINFSTGFFRKHLKHKNPVFIREGYDHDKKNQLVFEFCFNEDKSNELLKLTYTKSRKTCLASIIPIVNNFNISIDNIAGYYKDSAIQGPVKLDGTGREIFILNINKRQDTWK